ncbi:MAG: DNA repair protein RecN [Bacteroides sp.]|nr:DNA repair protein RecN [Eubacterium sp.]MCM1418940.1 DNA repair protein RecN [Roseburia sp.]MCM1462116.1 DNA repair protein RecN [Bacteroides sp.]
MLKELYIENLAVIEKASISFGDRFNVFSGETGAGKSILIGAINAVLGGRVSKELIRTGATKATVSALFDLIPPSAAVKLEEYGFSPEGELLLQREFSLDGKSVVRIGGKPATAAILKEISASLIDIHGQHDNRILVDTANQRDLLDNYGGLTEERREYGEVFRGFSKLSRRIKQLEEENAAKDEKIERLLKQIDEVERLHLKKGDESAIAEQLHRAQNYEEICGALLSALANVGGGESGESGAVDLLSAASASLDRIRELVPDCEAAADRLAGLVIELQDIGTELSGLLPEEDTEVGLSSLEEKMSEILRLKRKYAMEFDEILDEKERWREELKALSDADHTLDELSEEKKKLGDRVKRLALALSERRRAAADRLTEAISEQLRFLNMPDVRMEFSIRPGKVTVYGMDEIEILISVNKGEEMKPIGKVASGGELSRIMLAIKSVLAEHDDIPTMIFDEIDTGISGYAAQKVGKKLSEIARKRQVLCVTHLAQIAALSDRHLLIEKRTDETRTFTTIRALDHEEKVRELARIISGDAANEASLRNAEELIRSGKADGEGELCG